MSDTLKEKIIKSLVESEKISKDELDKALQLQKDKGLGLDKILIERGLINEKDLLVLLVRELNIPFINLSKYKIDPELKKIVPEKIARQYHIVPLSALEYSLTLAVADPLNVFLVDDLKNITGKDIDLVMSTESEITKVLDSFYGEADRVNMAELTKELQVDDFEIISEKDDLENQDQFVDESEQAPIIRLVNTIIKEALAQRASDIHIEPFLDCIRVRYRIDGHLKEILNLSKEKQNAMTVRIKIMSRLDITAGMIPQDGRFKMSSQDKEVDFRVSILPTSFGEKVVMRVLDKANLSIGLDGLGFSEKSLVHMKSGIQKPFGMMLVTGPTGSGKSTTLYSVLNVLNTIERNIITVEDPVEYQIEGLTQIQAQPDIGFTFAQGLRAILRQSPDVVMVGEIRDNETADIAIKAALTGQLVLSTLHTNDACGALTRLVDMNVEPFLVASSIVLVSAQRLTRKICVKCKEKIEIPDPIREKHPAFFADVTHFYHGKGCEACQNTGAKGRTCVTEVFEVTDEIRELLLEGKSSDEIKDYARKHQGLTTLFEDAMSKCINGEITYDEVLRVTSDH
jgi:type IV pilus assembly protein PilB